MIESNLVKIRTRIASVAGKRPVKLIGVSKNVRPERIEHAYAAGLRDFGENRIQEATAKIPLLPEDIQWHFIGHLQSNKVRDAVQHFSWIQSIDSLRLIRLINQEAAKQNKIIQTLIEVNVGGEESKHGVDPGQLLEILQSASDLQNVRVLGLMAIPPLFEDPEKVRPYFRRLKELADWHSLKELSMGMSHDYWIAIEEGATMIRVGTSLFGPRL